MGHCGTLPLKDPAAASPPSVGPTKGPCLLKSVPAVAAASQSAHQPASSFLLLFYSQVSRPLPCKSADGYPIYTCHRSYPFPLPPVSSLPQPCYRLQLLPFFSARLVPIEIPSSHCLPANRPLFLPANLPRPLPATAASGHYSFSLHSAGYLSFLPSARPFSLRTQASCHCCSSCTTPGGQQSPLDLSGQSSAPACSRSQPSSNG